MRNHALLLLLLVLLSVLTFVDRLCIAVAGPRMQAELGITTEQWGWVLGAFVLSYGLFEIPTGMMGDRWGQRAVLARIVLWWSAFTALTGVMTGFAPLVATRFLFGAGEAGAYPNMAGVVAQWFEKSSHARAQGYIWGASRAGGALAPLLVVPIQQAFGWRPAFWIFGAAGVIWCVAWLALYRDPVKTATTGSSPHATWPWKSILASRQMWIIMAMYASYAWGSWFYFSWLHTYLIKGRGFTENEMAAVASLPFAFGAAANIGGGYLSDFACRKLGIRRGRTIVGSTCLAASACMLVATAILPGKVAAAVLLTLGFGVMDLMLPSAWALCIEIGGPHAGAVSGAMNTAGQLGGFVCTVVFGYVVTATSSYHAPLYVIAAMLLVSAALFRAIDAEKAAL